MELLQGLKITRHADARIRQRGMRDADVVLLLQTATQVRPDAYRLDKRDAQYEISKRRQEIQDLERLSGCVAIIESGHLVTIYPSTKSGKKSRARGKRRPKDVAGIDKRYVVKGRLVSRSCAFSGR